MSMKRETVLIGICLLWSVGVMASGRTRGESEPIRDQAAENAAPAGDAQTVQLGTEITAMEEIRPGVLQVTYESGDTYIVGVDGAITLDYIAEGSRVSRGEGQRQDDGSMLFEDGTVINEAASREAASAAAASSAPRTLDGWMQEKTWYQVQVEGFTTTHFEDGFFPAELVKANEVPGWAAYHQTMAHRVIGGRMVYEDGATFADEPAEAGE